MAYQVNSERERQKFINNGFLYVFDRYSVNQLVAFYRCEQKDRCKARIHVQDGEVIKIINNHSHDATPAKIEVAKVKTQLKKRAEESQEPTVQVINHCVTNLSQAGQASMPKHAALKKIIRRQRNKINAPPPAPLSLVDLVLPEEYQMYIANGQEEKFLLADSGPEANRILIFGREHNIRFLNDAQTLYVDGTFKSAPPLFAQVYVILVEIYGAVVPILYGLLPNKTITPTTHLP